ncbi:Uncharacterised protein [Halioglobus japonicus]|nr:Uncharacterised protein [Halioglobus japonicus]
MASGAEPVKAMPPGWRGRLRRGLLRHVSQLSAGMLTVCLVSLAWGEVREDVREAEQLTRFQRTAQYLQDAPRELRGDFATIALSRLASAYFAEAKLAREQARQQPHLMSWSVRVDRYASQMPLLLDDIELGFPVRLSLGAEKSLAITVADRTVILSHPRLYEQNAFEQGILVAFCARHHCEQFSADNRGEAPIPLSVAKIRPQWSFTAHESTCTYHGIVVRFNNTRNMANARLICEQFMQEVMTLTDELAWQSRHAVPIDWGQLVIQPTPHRPEHMLQLNSLGDTVLVTVPMLYRSSGLLSQVLPWIRQRVTQQVDPHLELDADDYGWQKP